MTTAAEWTWIVARTSNGSAGIVAEASAQKTIDAMMHRAERNGAIIDHIKRPEGVHWDGGRCSADETKRIRAGIRRNA